MWAAKNGNGTTNYAIVGECPSSLATQSLETNNNNVTRRRYSLFGLLIDRTLGSNAIQKKRLRETATCNQTDLINKIPICNSGEKPTFSNQYNVTLKGFHESLNLSSQGPWSNLIHPGIDRIAFNDTSNWSTNSERKRLSSIRVSYDSIYHLDEHPSFQRVQTSTPLDSFPLNLSISENSVDDTPLNLVVIKQVQTSSFRQRRLSTLLDLRRNKPMIIQDQLDIVSPQLAQEESRRFPQAVDFSDCEHAEDFSDDNMDPDWLPDGDATTLNDLSIYEYFEQFKNDHLSDNNSEVSLAIEENEHIFQADVGEPQAKKSKSFSPKENRKLKEKGLQYIKRDGTLVPARHVQPPCACRMRCNEKFSEPVRKKLLASLLDLTYPGQNQFLSSHITVISTVRPQVLISRRTWSRIYKLPGVGGAVKVCKRMFVSTYDLKERKTRVLADKLVSGAGIARDDMRKDNTSRKKIDPEHAQYIVKHIKSFPVEESHYSREKSSCLYLSSDLTIHRMHELYQNQCGVDNIIPVHYNTYRLAFNSLNIKFRKPKVDTCNTCDMIKVELQVEKDIVKREEILVRKEAHQLGAGRMYDEKKQDRLQANTDLSVRTISFDLQKQLATPYLTCGRSFYSRQLYTYNLTIFETQVGKNIPLCYIWDETRAKRGSREIGSCLWAYMKNLPVYVEKLNMYSDRCAGQNNNRIILFLMIFMLPQQLQIGGNQNTRDKPFHKPAADGNTPAS
ncbi:uncharacterized protein LOC129773272 [Toxorhynchites rutilus septentrionalis]|uniref:uncharacterized protein LOC129773272 n=1 Tax=Toxorhynchites rutilus septentrionalis TaxID=329112 RepID=UPI00247AA509|nr:uncharacterized protein LOC129773272 [Toxorhynchites rutilus septentrionalis]